VISLTVTATVICLFKEVLRTENISFKGSVYHMYEHLEHYGVPKKVIEAMNVADRKLFVPEEYSSSAYFDIPLPIGFGQTISAPHMVGIMCSALDLSNGDKVLEIGTGSGYNAAVMATLVGDDGWIYTIERIDELAKIAKERFELLGIKNVTVVIGDGKKGLPEYAPFEKIAVTCYVRHVPKELTSQLTNNGILIIPVGDEYVQVLKKIMKVDGRLYEQDLMNVRFVPLI